jgi:general secretion pathway protein H
MKPRDQWGFTLIEMIVVLAVMALVLGLVVTRGPLHSQRIDLDATAREVAGALRLARSRAIAEEQPVTVSFGAGGYRLDSREPSAWPADVVWRGNQLIVFLPDGGASGGRIALGSGAQVVTIDVDWLTGRVLMR